MWIIIEGSTCSGKSTLEKTLMPMMGDPFENLVRVHFGPPRHPTRRGVLEEYVTSWEMDQKGRDFLADRWHWGEITYSPIYRPETNKDGFGLLGLAGWRWVEMFLLSRGAITVLLRADPDILERRLLSRGDDQVKKVEDLKTVAKLYDQTFQLAPSAHHVWDTSIVSSEKTNGVARMLVQAAQIMERKAAPVKEFRGYIGNPLPRALLVGDRRNVGNRAQYERDTKLPFMPVNGNSGDYLLRALPDDLWPSIGMVNSAEYPLTLPELWDALNRPPVVALGSNALDRLRKHKIPHKWVYHPQYVRRFEHKSIDDYGQQILNAIELQEK